MAQRPKARPRPKKGGSKGMRVGDLARRSGLSVRNLRKLHTMRLLPAPELQGRTAYYGEEHLARVVVIRRMQRRGFSLVSIGELLRGMEHTDAKQGLAELERRLVRSSPTRGLESAPVRDILPELADNAGLLRQALALELAVKSEGEVVAPIAELLHIAREHRDAGIPLDVVLRETAFMDAELARIAEHLRDTFFVHIGNRAMDAGLPASELELLGRRTETLRAGTIRAVTLLFGRAIERATGAPRVAPVTPKKKKTQSRR